MAKTKTRKPRTPRPKQGYLPTMEPPSIPEIDAAAEHYYEVMTERCRLSKEEDEAKLNLLAKMREHKQERYTTPDDLVVTLLVKEGLKVKPKAKEGVELNGDA